MKDFQKYMFTKWHRDRSALAQCHFRFSRTLKTLLLSAVFAGFSAETTLAVRLQTLRDAPEITENFNAETPAETAAPAEKKPDKTENEKKENDTGIAWQSDLDDAGKIAGDTDKDLLIVFFGDGTQQWSRKLEFEIFNQKEFFDTAGKSFVFVRIDFVKNTNDNARLKKNRELAERWDIGAIPTVVLADKNARPYAITGYRDVPAADYAQHLERRTNIRKKRDEALAAAAIDTDARPPLLAQALRTMDEAIILRHYTRELDELKRLDLHNFSGLMSDLAFATKLGEMRATVLRKIREEKNDTAALAAIDKFIADEKPQTEHLQKTLFLKMAVFGRSDTHNHVEIVRLMDQIIAIKATSEQGLTAVDVRARAIALLTEEEANGGAKK